MAKTQVFFTDYTIAEQLDLEQEILDEINAELVWGKCKTEQEVLDQMGDPDAIITQWAPLTRKAIEKCTKCKVISRNGIGVDNIDLKAAQEQGIAVTNCPRYCIPEVADHAMALALAQARKLQQTIDDVRSGKWNHSYQIPVYRLADQVFGVVGIGPIGSAVIKRAKPFFREVLALDPFAPEQQFAEIGARKVDSEEFFKSVDFVTFHVPYNAGTHHMLNADVLNTMKPNAYVINTCRGAVIDTAALVDALQAKKIAGAGLDVHEQEPLPMDHPLRSMSNVILTPHSAFYSEQSCEQARRETCINIVNIFKGEPPISRLV